MSGRQGRPGWAILFCGVPGTLKTFLASRLSGKLGFGYLPTRLAGGIPTGLDPRRLTKLRRERYLRVAEPARGLVELGATIVIDGGFTTSAARQIISDRVGPQRTIVVHCFCPDEALRHRRLLLRSCDPLDHESASAGEIARSSRRFESSVAEEDPRADLTAGAFPALLRVNTGEMSTEWLGRVPRRLRAQLQEAVDGALAEYQASAPPPSYARVVQEHFDDLAGRYDTSTDWRAHPRLLASLHRELPVHPARVLDICSGTGLASEWYRERGHHVVGLDLSPVMLRHAAKRLTLTVLASAASAPFLDDYFDLVLIRQCLHYVDPVSVLRKARRIVRYDGKVAVASAVAPDEESRRLLREFKAVTQPLRLQVFTPARLQGLLEEGGFAVEDQELLEIPREESVENLSRRAPEPPGGWKAFLDHVAKLGAALAPGLDFQFDGGTLAYRQLWATSWARPR